MTRAFFDQIDDELRGLLGPALRNYRSERNARLLKLWYSDPAIHFEVQMVARRWSPSGGPVLEVGLHLENPDAGLNEQHLARLTATARRWRARLPEAEAGPALGPRGAQWRRLSELLAETDPDDPDLASEAAERLAGYVRTLSPLLDRLPQGSG